MKKDKKDDKKDVKKDDKKDDKKDGKKDAAADYQLSRALDLIRALSIYQRTGDTATDMSIPAPTSPVPAATPTGKK